MNDPWTDMRLGRVLASVGENLATEATAASAPPLRPARSPSTWLALAAAVVAVIAGLTLAVAPVREAVADFLGIGSTDIDVVPQPDADPAGLPTIYEGLTTLSPSAAASRLGEPLPDTSATRLGEPDRLAAMPEGGVLLIWSEDATTLWIHRRSIPAGDLYSKLIDSGQQAQVVEGLGDAALQVSGDHILATPHRRVAAGTVVLWTRGVAEYRLESDLDPATLLDLARHLDRPPAD